MDGKLESGYILYNIVIFHNDLLFFRGGGCNLVTVCAFLGDSY